LHVSKEEQKQRFLKRINDPAKNWKFSKGDIDERGFWTEYQKAYEDAISATSKLHAPWYVVPADKKWFTRLAVSEIIVEAMKKLKPEYPKLSREQLNDLKNSKVLLLDEKK
jgi:polyphosphate kinase 2 (PPK2 family)